MSETTCSGGHRWALIEDATFSCTGCEETLNGPTLEKLAITDGDILVLTFPPELEVNAVRNIHEAMQQMLYRLGRKAAVLTVPEGVVLAQLSQGERAQLLKTLSAVEEPPAVN